MDRFAQARLKNMFAELLSDQSFADEVASRCAAQILGSQVSGEIGHRLQGRWEAGFRADVRQVAAEM